MWENKRVLTLVHAPFFEAAFIMMIFMSLGYILLEFLYVYILLFHAPCS